MEKTFVAVKPDGVQRGLVGTIIQRFETRGYQLVGLKLMQVSQALAENHYGEHQGKPFFAGLVSFITSGPIVAMVWEGKDVIAQARQMIGATDPLKADPGTLRGNLGIDVGRNIIHGSDSPASAEREIALFFTPEEIVSWEPSTHRWLYE